jgi:glycolate oxidase iron-sulfur subunit
MVIDREGLPLGSEMPAGTRFIGREPDASPRWFGPDAPSDADLSTCVACGLCLPHCPTYRLTGEESASPRGRIAAMRAVADGQADTDETFAGFMDLCLVCRACEDVCPSHVPFGRMMERARSQIERRRGPGARLLRWFGLDVVLARPWLVRVAAVTQRVVRPFLPARIRELVPRRSAPFSRLPRTTEPTGALRGTVALLSGCVQDRWFHDVNLATIRVLARNGWRVVVPPRQRCCGALHAHNGRLTSARRLAKANLSAFAGADVVVVNAAGCGAHMKDYADLVGVGLPVMDLMEFLYAEGLRGDPGSLPEPTTVAYHDACHALRAQRIHQQPRALLGRIANLEVREIPNADRCCGAAGLYNVTEPEMAGQLRREKALAVATSGASVVASANPGCSIQLAAGLRAIGHRAEIVHPVQLLDRASDAVAQRP